MQRDKLHILKMRKIELVRKLALYKEHRRKLVEFVSHLDKQIEKDLIDTTEYYEKLASVLQGRKPWQWMYYYEENIKNYEQQLKVCQRGLEEQEKPAITPWVIGVLLVIALSGLFFFTPALTGLTTFFEDSSRSISEYELQLPAEINKPVQWNKIIISNGTGKEIAIPRYASKIEAENMNSKKKTALKEKGVGYGVQEIMGVDEHATYIIDEVGEINISYETPAPLAIERNISNYKKEIVISSDYHYENILSYTALPVEAPVDNVHLYWVVNGSRDEIEFNGEDYDGDGLLDEIIWWTPSLSNQTYEVEITILNVQSYPDVGGIWEVNFTTLGKSNLTIRAINGTSFEDYDNSTEDDLEFLSLVCGDEILTTQLMNGEVFIPDYECNGIGSETSKVLTGGVHELEFEFGGQKAYAHNLAIEYLSPRGVIGDVDMVAINNTHFVVAYVNTSANNTQFRVMNTTGSVYSYNLSVGRLNGQGVGNFSRVAVSMINGTHFWIAWTNQNKSAEFRAVYGVDGKMLYGNGTNGTTQDGAVGGGMFTDLSLARMGNRTMYCYIDQAEGDFDAYFLDDGGRQTFMKEDIDAAIDPVKNMSNYIDCVGINHTTAAVIWYATTAADDTYSIIDYAGTTKLAATDIETAGGTGAAVSVTALNNRDIFLAFWDQADNDLRFTTRTGSGGTVVGAVNIDANAGAQRLDIAAVNNGTGQDYVVVVYSNNTALRGVVMNNTNFTTPITTIENNQNGNYRLLSVLGKNPVTNASLCNNTNNGVFGVAYTNKTDDFKIKWYWMNWTEWDGNCQAAAVADTTFPLVSYNAATIANNTNTSIKSIYVNVSVTEANEQNITFILYNTTDQVNRTTLTNGMRQFNHTSTLLNNVTYYFNVTVCDTSSNCNTTDTRTIIIDDKFPLISYNTQTIANNSNISYKSIYVNLTLGSDDSNFVNVTFTLYNTTSQVNQTTSTSKLRQFNHTSTLLNNVTYYFNVTICDIAANCNTTDTRNVSIDNVGPTMNNPLINATSDVDLNSFVKVNVSITDLSIFNVTLEVDPPSSAAYNVTPTRAANAIEWLNSTIKLSQTGQWVFRFYANDSAGNNATRFAQDGAANNYINVIATNAVPRIHNITNYTLPSSSAPVEGGVRLFSFTFNATDVDGTPDLNPATARMEFNYSGEPLRSNYSCAQLLDDTATNTIMFNCSIEMHYFDISGGWTINASVADDAGEMATNFSTSFTYATLTAMKMNQTALRWPSLTSGSTNITSNNDAAVINNTGNVNITAGNIQITGYDLQGEILGGFFNVSNFTASWKTGGDACSGASCIECDAAGTSLRNATSRAISVANVSRGNNSAGLGQEELYFCIQRVPPLAPQPYFSNASNWLIAVS